MTRRRMPHAENAQSQPRDDDQSQRTHERGFEESDRGHRPGPPPLNGPGSSGRGFCTLSIWKYSAGPFVRSRLSPGPAMAWKIVGPSAGGFGDGRAGPLTAAIMVAY